MRLIIILCIAPFPVLCIAQNSYVELDTITYAGVKVIDQGKRLNALTCQWQKSKNVDDTMMISGGEAYNAALVFYASAKISLVQKRYTRNCANGFQEEAKHYCKFSPCQDKFALPNPNFALLHSKLLFHRGNISPGYPKFALLKGKLPAGSTIAVGECHY